VTISADIKSLVWYRPDPVLQPRAIKYLPPGAEWKRSWTKWLPNGDTPWAMGIESGAASGWPATGLDAKNIMLRIRSA